MEGSLNIDDRAIDRIINKYNPKAIYQFGSSLDSLFARDIDLLIVCDRNSKDYQFQKELNYEFKSKYDLSFTKNEKEFFQKLSIKNFKQIFGGRNGYNNA